MNRLLHWVSRNEIVVALRLSALGWWWAGHALRRADRAAAKTSGKGSEMVFEGSGRNPDERGEAG